MDDLIAIAFFAFAWLMAAAGSRKKQQERRRRQGLPQPPPRESREPASSAPSAERPRGADRPQRGRDLIPESIWEEIEALASGRPRPKPAPPEPVAPAPSLPLPEPPPPGTEVVLDERPRARPLPERSRTPRAREARPVPVSSTELVPVRQSRALDRSAPTEVVEVPTEEVDDRRERPSRPAVWLGLSDPGAARRAMILKEVLGPPLASRDPRDLAG